VRMNETYNAKDQLTSITPQGQAAIPMSYTGAGQFERVTRGTTTFTTGALGLAREQNGGTTDYRYDPDGLLLVIRSGSSATYPLYDGLGSVVATSDAAGVARYDPFGACLENCPSGPYRWLGGLGVYWDDSMKLYKMGTRYYDPALGRFTQVDPVAGGAANRYDYAFQNPINVVDVTGMAGCTRSLDTLGRIDFTDACDRHDTCYGNWGSWRILCDKAFLGRMRGECGDQPFYRRPFCYTAAQAYYTLVVGLKEASKRFIRGQMQNCRLGNRSSCARLANRRNYKYKIGKHWRGVVWP
jgi:RHS repeat-associated protein